MKIKHPQASGPGRPRPRRSVWRAQCAQLAALVLMPPILLNTAIKAFAAIGLAGWRKAWPGAAVLGASIIAALGALPFLLGV